MLFDPSPGFLGPGTMKVTWLPTPAGYGIREPANAIGTNGGHLSRIECGHRCPSPEVAERIASLYRLPIAVSDRLMAAAALTREFGRSMGVR